MDFNPQKISQGVYAGLFIFATLIAGGVLFISVFFKPFFYHTDTFRLSAIALGLSLPLVLVNGIMYVGSHSNPRFANALEVGGTGTLLSLPALYVASILGYFFSFGAKAGVGIALGIDIVIISLLIINSEIRDRKAKKKTVQSPT